MKGRKEFTKKFKQNLENKNDFSDSDSLSSLKSLHGIEKEIFDWASSVIVAYVKSFQQNYRKEESSVSYAVEKLDDVKNKYFSFVYFEMFLIILKIKSYTIN